MRAAVPRLRPVRSAISLKVTAEFASSKLSMTAKPRASGRTKSRAPFSFDILDEALLMFAHLSNYRPQCGRDANQKSRVPTRRCWDLIADEGLRGRPNRGGNVHGGPLSIDDRSSQPLLRTVQWPGNRGDLAWVQLEPHKPAPRTAADADGRPNCIQGFLPKLAAYAGLPEL
jgi:hypothetical protein